MLGSQEHLSFLSVSLDTDKEILAFAAISLSKMV